MCRLKCSKMKILGWKLWVFVLGYELMSFFCECDTQPNTHKTNILITLITLFKSLDV